MLDTLDHIISLLINSSSQLSPASTAYWLAFWLFLVCDDVFVMCRNLRICLRLFRNITTRLWPNETCHCVGGTGELLTSLVS